MSVVRDPQGAYRGVVGGDHLGGLGVGMGVDPHSHFTEHAPRPPVPGEEGDNRDPHHLPSSHGGRPPTQSTQSTCYPPSKTDPSYRSSESPSSATPTPRRPDLDLGYEPEGSASPTPPYLKWAESLHSLLDDQEGIQLFRGFLRQEGCGDQLDFWFACSGFRKSSQEKRPKLAKAIYRKYIQDSNGIVSRQIKPATKSFIRDCVVRLHLDPAMFQQAQTEIQSTMEENTYPLFLKSDTYLEYTQAGEESPKPPSDHSSSSGPGQPGYLPTLTEDVEWRCREEEEEEEEEEESGDTQASRLTQRLLMETAPHRVSTNWRAGESREYRPCREPVVNPYYVNMGSARAPATSANDSEQQSLSSVSDGDTLSLTDSSVDGVPPYRYRKQHRREMHESAKANGRVPLPHIPRTYRVPKDVHVEPERFAVDLISRLEAVLRGREAQERLEERLKRVRLEEEGDDADVSMVNSLPPYGNKPLPPSTSSLFPHYGSRYSETSYNGVLALQDAHEENPEAILDEHVQRVMETPGCQSPGTGRHSPKSRSPDGGVYPPPHSGRTQWPPGVKGHKPGAKGGDPVGMGAGVYHHKHGYHYPPGGTKPKEPQMDEVVLGGGGGGSRTQGSGLWNGEAHHYSTGKGRNYADGAGTMDAMGYSSKGSTLSKRGSKKGAEPTGKGDEGRVQEAQVPLEDLERNHKILQWMMEGEALRHKKNTHGSTTGSRKTQGSVELLRPSSVERPGAVHPWVSAQLRNNVQPSHPFIQDPTMPPNPAPNPLTQLEEARRRLEEERRRTALLQAKQRQKSLSSKKQGSQCENVTVAYYFCGEPIPYRTTAKGCVVTLGQFKELLTKKGFYRFYFKKVSDEFDCGVVFEEVKEDDAVLPIYEEKIIGKVEKVD
ncbi:axin-1-like isoform X1 [Oncorhynchus mykiss]|uniref:Axin-1 n=2 Tax=Oncorhynchus mykiss TaxID=8022 RepID=A0A8K9XAT7_ONCMY|nr:axin-1-like isoform X1 [Oncorhynchus mykiss]XP_036829214.1 axin-1-like isoform X1 [Oncorhynchus mykiss]